MLGLVPIVIDENNICLSGNMRLRALKELGYAEVEIIRAKDLTEEQKQEFVVKANKNYGEWDLEILAKGWSAPQLSAWGLELGNILSKTAVPVSFSAKARIKGTLLKVQCKTPFEAEQLMADLLAKGFSVELK